MSEPTTPEAARKLSADYARRIAVCLNAGEHQAARDMLAKSLHYALLALEIEQEKAA